MAKEIGRRTQNKVNIQFQFSKISHNSRAKKTKTQAKKQAKAEEKQVKKDSAKVKDFPYHVKSHQLTI